MNRREKTALSYWFPQIEAAGIPVPRTKILHMPKAAQQSIWHAFDGKDDPDSNDAMKVFIGHVAEAAVEFGYPAFLRTDHTSGKHEWDRCCFLKSRDDIAQHLFNLAEYSEIVDLMGLPWDAWVVREFLPTKPLGRCPRYGNMPICREFRFFVDDGHVRCWHPYWPEFSLEQGGAIFENADYDALSLVDVDEECGLIALAEKAGRAVGGAWSIDILYTKRGWYVTDMAEAANSWHEWPDCPNTFKKRKAA